MNISDALGVIFPHLNDDDIALFTTGMISRYAFSCNDRKSNFYMLGSMGLVSSVGLGIAFNTKKRVFVFDGDGSLLMDMGTMAMISYERPRNLIHILLDNEAYESTGNQPTVSKEIDLSRIAKSMGYSKVLRIGDSERLKSGFKAILSQPGPVFVLIKVDVENEGIPPRVFITPEGLTRRICNALKDRARK